MIESIIFEDVGYSHYQCRDLFNGNWIPCSESLFDDCVVQFRSQFKMSYEGKYQVFTNIRNEFDAFRRY